MTEESFTEEKLEQEKTEPTKKELLIKAFINAVKEGLLVLCAAVIIGCPLKRFLGFSCPGCGITRAYLCFITGQFQKAFYYHPLFPLLPVVFLIYAFRNYIPKKILNISLTVILIVYIGTYLYRIFVIHSPVTTFDFKESIIYTIYQYIKPYLPIW